MIEGSETIHLNYIPVDYSKILGDARVLFLGEDHHNFSIPDHIVDHAADLKKAGITHFAIEANADEENNDALEKLNKGEVVDPLPFGLAAGTLGPYIYTDQIFEVSKQGIQIVAVDELQYRDAERRESTMTNRLLKILQDPNARVAFRVGLNHANRKKEIEKGVPSVASRLSKQGFPVSVVDFIGGEEVSTLDEPRFGSLVESIKKEGLGEDECMLDVKNSPELFPADLDADFYIYLPQE